jgi:hypothetical protein
MLHSRRRKDGVGRTDGIGAELKAVSSVGGGSILGRGLGRRHLHAGMHDTRTAGEPKRYGDVKMPCRRVLRGHGIFAFEFHAGVGLIGFT